MRREIALWRPLDRNGFRSTCAITFRRPSTESVNSKNNETNNSKTNYALNSFRLLEAVGCSHGPGCRIQLFSLLVSLGFSAFVLDARQTIRNGMSSKEGTSASSFLEFVCLFSRSLSPHLMQQCKHTHTHILNVTHGTHFDEIFLSHTLLFEPNEIYYVAVGT